MSDQQKQQEKNDDGQKGNEHRQCPMSRDATAIKETVTPSSAIDRSCPININNGPDFHKSLKNKLDAAGISLCPMMGKSLSVESKDYGAPTLSTPTESIIRPDTPEEEKLDVRHLSLALMKLLYPKVRTRLNLRLGGADNCCSISAG